MINVRDDWNWVSAHVDEELQNEILFEEVQAWAVCKARLFQLSP